MTSVTLVTGTSAGIREAAIAAVIDNNVVTALILEGLPSGVGSHDYSNNNPHIHISRIAPGCICCTGNLTMRVTLNRILKRQPTRLFISLASSEHLVSIQDFLSQAPYDALLSLTEAINCN